MPAIPDVRPFAVLNANTLGANIGDQITFNQWVKTVVITNRGVDDVRLSITDGGAFVDVAPGASKIVAVTAGRDGSVPAALWIESPTTTQAYRAEGYERVF